MRHRLLACAAALVMTILVISTFSAQADTDLDAIKDVIGLAQRIIDTMQRIGQILSEAKAPVRQAVSFVVMGMHSYTLEDSRLNAQAVINLLEGSESEHFDPAIDVIVDFDKGICPHLEQLNFTLQEWSTIEDETSSEGMEDGWERYLRLFQLASEIMQDMLDGADVEDAFLTAYALLSVGQDGITGMLQTWGFEIWVSPGESIQAAIDIANEGATIYLEPGTYRETLEITQSITIEGWMAELPQTSDGVRRAYGTVLQPVGDQVGILIHSSEPIVVEIRRLSIEEASNGITVSGNAQLLLEDIDVVRSEVGIDISSTASVEMSNCYLEYNDISVLLTGTSKSEIRDCRLQYCDNLLGALQVLESSSVTVSGSFIRDNAGSGIFVSDQARLVIEDSYIVSNGGDGVLLAGDCQVEMNGTSITWNEEFGVRAVSEECSSEKLEYLRTYTGTVDGSTNLITPPSTVGGNWKGAICPASLLFLIEPDSEDE